MGALLSRLVQSCSADLGFRVGPEEVEREEELEIWGER